jgi:hypothetical protein
VKSHGFLALEWGFATSHCVILISHRTEKMHNYSYQFLCSDGFYDISSKAVTNPMPCSNIFLKCYTLPKTPYKRENFSDERAMGEF